MLGLLVSAVLMQPLDAEQLGQIDFPTSAVPAAQKAFLRGALLLHSFEYGDAAEAFREAQGVEPGFAMAYWGEAMTYCHPIWATEDVAAARAVLARLAPTREERAAKAPTEREKGFLAAVEALYADGEWRVRYASYSAAMADLHARFPDDLEVASFYSLSILGTVRGERDIPTYMRAAAVAEEVYQRAPQHPGAIHYLIHSYDDPVHAPLGLRLARVYGRVAPAAAHALHMPSHIFVALGMWDESAAANESSSAAADARIERKKLGIEERGYHSLWWLGYTYLQQGRQASARALVERMQQDATASGSVRTRQHLALMRAEYVINAQAWDGKIAGLAVDTKDLDATAVAADLFTTGMARVRTGKVEAAREILAEMHRRYEAAAAKDSAEKAKSDATASCCRPASVSGYAALGPRLQSAMVMELELRALIDLNDDKTDAALLALQDATAREDARTFDFGPPVVVKPAHELLGEVLLGLGRAADARREFELALERAPRRAASMLGRMQAAARAGDAKLEQSIKAELRAMFRSADASVLAQLGGSTP